MIVLYILGGLLATVVAARTVFDRLARHFHWRIGRWSDVLPGWKLSRCLRCRTSWRYAVPHDTPYEFHSPIGTVERREIFPLCHPCWEELGVPAARLPYYEELWASWQQQLEGAEMIRRDPRDLVAIRASLEVGL